VPRHPFSGVNLVQKFMIDFVQETDLDMESIKDLVGSRGRIECRAKKAAKYGKTDPIHLQQVNEGAFQYPVNLRACRQDEVNSKTGKYNLEEKLQFEARFKDH